MKRLAWIAAVCLCGVAWAEAEKPPAPPAGWGEEPMPPPATKPEPIKAAKPTTAKADAQPTLRLPLRLDDHGVFPVGGKTNRAGPFITLNADVRQVVDENNMIVELMEVDVTAVGKGGNARLEKQTVWVRGISTKGVVDDETISFKQAKVFKVSDTKRYATVAGGSKTIFLIEPAD